jgi:hypothetical protein
LSHLREDHYEVVAVASWVMVERPRGDERYREKPKEDVDALGLRLKDILYCLD